MAANPFIWNRAFNQEHAKIGCVKRCLVCPGPSGCRAILHCSSRHPERQVQAREGLFGLVSAILHLMQHLAARDKCIVQTVCASHIGTNHEIIHAQTLAVQNQSAISTYVLMLSNLAVLVTWLTSWKYGSTTTMPIPNLCIGVHTTSSLGGPGSLETSPSSHKKRKWLLPARI